MCCDICSQYEECEAENSLKDNCCRRCPEHGYCIEEGEGRHKKDNYNKDNSDMDLYE